MDIMNISVSILAICGSVLAIAGTLVVLFTCGKEFYEYVSDFMRDQRARRQAKYRDEFQYKTLEEAITQCRNKGCNSFCNVEERSSYRQLEGWLTELKNTREKK